ncbi:MAG: hypothetical protein IKF07_06900 [Eubacterium sp.]|nr:hypothetical protein [Eubacterium sp.]
MTLSAYGKYGSAARKLGDAVKSGIVSHAYIIEGDSNIDKMGFARAFLQALTCREMPGEGCGKCVNCRKIADGNHEDLYVVEPDDTTAAKSGTVSIKDAAVEDLQVRLKEKPTAGEHNMAVISGGDTMTTRAQTRFLKTLEEPPEGTVIMILSENSEELLPTINSRCVNIRLYDALGEDRTEGAEEAEKILRMIMDKAYFADIRSELDNAVRSRQDAYMLLDGLESLIGSIVRGNEELSLEPDQARVSTELIEEARRDIKLGAGYNYRIRSLVLRLGEAVE